MSEGLESESGHKKEADGLVKVFFRIYPIAKPSFKVIKLKNNSRVYVKKKITLKPDCGEYWQFITDGVFSNANQEDIYKEVMDGLIEKLEFGHNIVVVGFGRTGTGKSTTITGLEYSDKDYGIAPRVIRCLLNLKSSLKVNKKMSIKMSYLEFSKTDVFDLFRDFPNRLRNHWKLANDSHKVKIKSEMQALEYLYAGEGRKEAKQIQKYMSHINTSILTLYVVTRDLEFSDQKQVAAKIHLVDMAGLDVAGSISSYVKSPVEVGEANLNKSYMEQFFFALCDRAENMIKIKRRSNPFLFFLGRDLKQQSFLRFIGHITTSSKDYSLTMSMLKFGQIIKGFTPAVVNLEYEISPDHKLKYFQKKVKELEIQRIQNSILLNQDLSENLNCERIDHLSKSIKEYMRNEINEIDLMSVADASAVFKLFKGMLEQSENERKNLKDPSSLTGDSSDVSVTRRKSTRKTNYLQTQQAQPVKYKDEGGTPPSAKSTKPKTLASRGSLKQKQSYVTSSGNGEQGNNFIPDILPENREVWTDYSKQSTYNLLLEQSKNNEKNIMDIYKEYLDELKQMQNFKNQTDAMRQELLEARILMDFKERSGAVDENTESILNDAEALCKETMEKAEQSKLEQEEIVLRCLAELKVYLNIRKELKKNLNKDFEEFCRMKFNLPLIQDTSLSEVELAKGADQKEPICQEVLDIELERKRSEQERYERLSHLNAIMLESRKHLERMRHYTKPYRLTPLPEHRDAPTVYKTIINR